MENKICGHCHGLIAIRMPVPDSGCDHLYYPDNCEVCKKGKYAGAVYDPQYDEARLDKQMGRVYSTMIDGFWRTLGEIENRTSDPQASISAQLRHLRKPKFGSYTVNRRPRGDREKGLFEYQLLKPKKAGELF